MHFSTIFASAAAFVIGTSALAIREEHVAEINLYSENGCANGNLGPSTVFVSELDKCSGFSADIVKSVVLTSINDGCQLTLYTDDAHNASPLTAKTYYCDEAYEEWKAWKVTCTGQQ